MKESGLAFAERSASSARRRFSQGSQRDRPFRLALAPALVVLAGVTVLPVIFLIAVSLTQFDLARPSTWTDFSNPLAGYLRVLRDARFAHSLVVQIQLSLATVTLQLGMGLMGAVLLNHRTRLIALLRVLLLLPMVLPPIVGAIIWKVLFAPEISPVNWVLGLLHLPQPTWLAQPGWALVAVIIADVWQWFPFPLLAILAAMQMIPPELNDAARADGASDSRVFWHITLPLVMPAIFVVALFRLIDSLKAFPLIFVMTEGGPGTATEATNYYAYLQGFSFGFIGYSSAMAFIMLVMTFALSAIIVGRLGRPVDLE